MEQEGGKTGRIWGWFGRCERRVLGVCMRSGRVLVGVVVVCVVRVAGAQSLPVGVSANGGPSLGWESTATPSHPPTAALISGITMLAVAVPGQIAIGVAHVASTHGLPLPWFPFLPLIGPFVGANLAAGRPADAFCTHDATGTTSCADVRGLYIALYLLDGAVQVSAASLLLAAGASANRRTARADAWMTRFAWSVSPADRNGGVVAVLRLGGEF